MAGTEHDFAMYRFDLSGPDRAGVVRGTIFGQHVDIVLTDNQWDHLTWRVSGFGPFPLDGPLKNLWKLYMVDALVELGVVPCPEGYVPFNGETFDPTDRSHYADAEVEPLEVHACSECGEHGPCAYDDEGRPMVHVSSDRGDS